MPTIDVDFDVYKAILLKRPVESITENDVLRQLLGLSSKISSPVPPPATASGSWTCKGVTFPAGTLFRAFYKGEEYEAKVEDGALVLAGERYDSPSPAAASITKTSINGWDFWECRFPGNSEWQVMKALRKQRSRK